MNLLLTAAAALAGALVLEAVRMPSGALVGAVLGVAAVNLAGHTAYALPAAPRFAAFVLLGWAIGTGVTSETLTVLRGSVLPLVFVVVALIALGGAVSAVAVAAGWMDVTTAYLAASPGALSQMSALAQDLKADAALVAAVHTVRVVAVVVVSPIVARFLAGV